METTARSNAGCWTCRCRRKKCDERSQPCTTCESLRLPCHGYGERPKWMDGDVQEKAQALAFKAHVKHNTTLKRRSKARSMSSVHRTGEGAHLQIETVNQSQDAAHHVQPESIQQSSIVPSNQAENPNIDALGPPFFHAGGIDYFQEFLDDIDHHTDVAFDVADGAGEVADQSFSLPDSSFVPASSPLPTPLCSKNFFDVLDLETGSQAVSLPVLRAFSGNTTSSLHSPILPHGQRLLQLESGDTVTGSREVGQLALGKVQRPEAFSPQDRRAIGFYTETMFPALFPFLTPEYARGVCHYLMAALKESKIFLSSIIAQSVYCQQSQLRRFGLTSADFEETATTNERFAIEGLHHKIHKSKLLNDKCHDEEGLLEIQVCTTQVLLSQMLRGSHDWPRIVEAVTSFNPTASDQAFAGDRLGLNFNQEVLVYLEILSCTVTGSEPKFAKAFIQGLSAKERSRSWSNVTGIESWLMSCLVDIMVLRHWKDDQILKGSLSMAEMVKRALSIEQDLKDGRQASQQRNDGQPLRDSWVFTNVFASAASIFLHATISDARPHILEIKDSVSDVIAALQLLPRPDLLKRLSWPICIAACLADVARYEFFNTLSQRVTEAYGKGENISRALTVARECWRLRGSRDQDDQTYDWRDAMRSLGTPLLLY